MEAMPGFWDDSDNAAKIQKEKAVLESVLKLFEKLKNSVEEFEILLEYSAEGDDDSLEEAKELFPLVLKSVEDAEQKVLLSEDVDPNNAIISINAGAGGTESCDWASMLLRMLSRYCEKNDFKVSLLDSQDGDSAGIKSATFLAEGSFAYGLLKSESGVHRLVRISPFDSNARRHTSFASVYISPEIDDDIEIEIEQKDLRIDTYRASGAGGQHVNTTDSAVRITHLPSGIVVSCQNQRSQHKNKDQAMKVLRSRLFEKAMEEKREKERQLEDSKMEIGWGSQIRSYVLHPYKMVKDHRTNFEYAQPDKVLDGELEGFVNQYLQWMAAGE